MTEGGGGLRRGRRRAGGGPCGRRPGFTQHIYADEFAFIKAIDHHRLKQDAHAKEQLAEAMRGLAEFVTTDFKSSSDGSASLGPESYLWFEH